MSSQATPQAPAKVLVDCAKCDGRGRINAFAHVVGGRCFDCEGAGKLEVDALTAAEMAEAKVQRLIYTAAIAMSGAYCGNMEYAHAYIGQLLSGMFEVGSERAREILNYIGTGRYWDAQDNRYNQLDADVACALRTRLISLGREVKAAA